MKNTLTLLTVTAAALSLANGAQINVTNFDTAAPPTFNAVVDSNGAAIANGAGFASVGTFTLPAADINIGNASAVLADFVLFGATGDFADEGAFSAPGLYNFDTAAPTVEGDAFVGNPLFTLITDSATFADATELLVFQHTSNFEADDPLFTGSANLALDTGGTLLIGTAGATTTVAGAGEVAALTLAAVPEPSAVLLAGLGSMLMIVRRRR